MIAEANLDARVAGGIAYVKAGLRALVLLLAALLLPGCNRHPADSVLISGGCVAQKSPYLAKDPGLLYSRISYCDAGDASLSRIELHVPVRLLDRYQIVVAGYPSNPGLEATLLTDRGGSAPVKLTAAERWEPLSVPEALLGHAERVTVIVDDRSTQMYGWAGVGLAPRSLSVGAYPWAAVVAALLFALILARDFMRLRKERDGSGGTVAHLLLSRPVTAALLGLLTVSTALFRRPGQLFSPYIWVEEGTISLKQFLTNGAAFLFDPVAGYLIIPSKLIFLLATTVPSEHFPLALALGSVLFCWFTLTILSIAPSHLKAPASVAAFVLVLPTASENYFTAHYSFWFGSLLLLPPLFWKETGKRQLLSRLSLTGLGGLSSPLVIALLPGFAYRLFIERTFANLLQVAVAAIASAVQFYFIKFSGTPGSSPELRLDGQLVIEKFFGLFWSPSESTAIYFGLTIILVALVFAVRTDTRNRQWAMLGAYCLFASILITAVRVPMDALHPQLGAPRYFFFPYIFLGLVILQLLPGSKAGNVLCGVILTCSLARFYDGGVQPHVPISWKHQLEMCIAAQGRYDLPVHYYGNREPIWQVDLSSDDCRVIASGWDRRSQSVGGP